MMVVSSGIDALANLASISGTAEHTAPTTCSSGSHSSSFLRDLIQISVTVVVTCIVLAVYQNRQRNKVQPVENNRTSLMKRQHGRTTLFCPKKVAIATQDAAAMLQEGQTMNGAFLSSIISQLWNNMNIAVSNSIKEILDPLLSGLAVPVHFVKISLGDVPIRTENIFVHPRVAPSAEGADGGGVQIDLDVVWDGNPDIMLQAGLATGRAHVTFGVQRIRLAGRMHILLSPLTTALPVVAAIQYGFTNPPTIELDFAGLAQSIAKQFAFVEPSIMSIVNRSLASMLVLPYRMIFPIDLVSYDYLDTYQPPLGVIRITVEKGRGFSILKKCWGNDIPDPYCLVSLGGSDPFRTSTQWNNCTPSWLNETCDFVLYDLDQKIYVQVHDDGLSRIDSGEELGRVEISARNLFQGENAGTVELELALNDLVHTGCYVTISAELSALSEQLQSLTSSKYECHHVCGLVAIIVTRAFDVPLPKEDASTFVKVFSREKEFITSVVTPDYPDNLNPLYSSAFHIPLTTDMMTEDDDLNVEEASTDCSPTSENTPQTRSILRKSLSYVKKEIKEAHWPRSESCSEDIVFTLMNDNSSNNKDPSELGSFTVTHASLLRAHSHTITDVRPIGEYGASLGFRVVLSGVQSEEENSYQTGLTKVQPHNSLDDSLSPTIANRLRRSISRPRTIRITALKGRGFHVDVRNLLIGTAHDIHDIYCCIRLLQPYKIQELPDSSCWRTSTIQDDTMPRWNESKTFVSTESNRDFIRVDAYNENRTKDDEYLGCAEYPVNTLLRKRVMEMELKMDAKPTGSFITLKCVAVSALPKIGAFLTQSQAKESIGAFLTQSQAKESNSEKDDGSHESVPRHKLVRQRISSSIPISKRNITGQGVKKALALSLPTSLPTKRHTFQTKGNPFPVRGNSFDS